MKQQKTVESRVLEILKECPMSRYDDMLLILHYYPDWTVEHPAHFYIFMSNTTRNQSCNSFYLGKLEQGLWR